MEQDKIREFTNQLDIKGIHLWKKLISSSWEYVSS